jgi:hypothetical protein
LIASITKRRNIDLENLRLSHIIEIFSRLHRDIIGPSKFGLGILLMRRLGGWHSPTARQ